jgi:hypothetical protein
MIEAHPIDSSGPELDRERFARLVGRILARRWLQQMARGRASESSPGSKCPEGKLEGVKFEKSPPKSN